MPDKNNIAAKIISGFFSEKVLKVLPIIDKGFVNQVFLVETENSRFIFRMKDDDSIDEYEKEAWASNQAQVKGVPVPSILKIGVFEGKAYSIQTFIEGLEGRNLSGNRKRIWKKLGEYTQKIHQIKVAGFGLKLRDMIQGNAESSWFEYLNYNLASLNKGDKLRKLGVINEVSSERIRESFEKLKNLKLKFGLNHGDLSFKNIIVTESETVYLIDWGSSEASIVPHHDLIQLLKMNLLENDPNDDEFKAFLAGYGISKDEFEKLLPDLKGLLLLRAFDKLRWAIDREVTNLEDYIFQAKKNIKKFL